MTYIYAIFHAPTYRNRYAEILKIDFPRVPLTSDPALFWRLATLGREPVGLHLLDADAAPILRDFAHCRTGGVGRQMTLFRMEQKKPAFPWKAGFMVHDCPASAVVAAVRRPQGAILPVPYPRAL